MASRRVTFSFIILLIFSSVANSQDSNITETIENLLPTTNGGEKFREDVFKFGASEFDDSTPSNRQEYDFIIVGSGSAGATIANRLTEIEEARVLLIEAGNIENLFMDIPLNGGSWTFDKSKQWDYFIEPSTDYCRGMDDNRCNVVLGKVMGGSSTTNFLMATRGNKHNYDTWANLTGDKNWSYDGMIEYFKKLENYAVTLADTKTEAHGFDGPVHIENVRYRPPLVDAFVESGKEFGFPTQVDYNSGQATGFAYLQTNQIKGERMSTNRAYLHPIKGRKNLYVSMNSHVNKILIDAETKTASGVEFTKANQTIQVIANKEVILCAGGINSPKILMLSGIGPAEHLQSFNISVLKDAPVGENLMDHIEYAGLSFMINDTNGILTEELIKPSNPALSDYLTNRTGPFAAPNAIGALAFLNVDDFSSENESPNVEIIFNSLHMGADSLFHKTFGITDSYYQQFFGNTISRYGYTLFPVLMQPKSRGKVTLRSGNPEDKPKIFTNYFSDPDDVRVGIKMIKKAIEISKTKAMQKYGSVMNNATVPGCENHERDSDSYWECGLRTFSMTQWHYSGTCKMGSDNDPSAVVNTKLQVKGLKKLRVVDASIMPMIPTAHTHIPTVALAEKAADLIKSDWGCVD